MSEHLRLPYRMGKPTIAVSCEAFIEADGTQEGLAAFDAKRAYA